MECIICDFILPTSDDVLLLLCLYYIPPFKTDKKRPKQKQTKTKNLERQKRLPEAGGVPTSRDRSRSVGCDTRRREKTTIRVLQWGKKAVVRAR